MSAPIRTIGSTFPPTNRSGDSEDAERVAERIDAAIRDPTGRLKLFLDHTRARELPCDISRVSSLRELYCSDSPFFVAAIDRIARSLRDCLLACMQHRARSAGVLPPFELQYVARPPMKWQECAPGGRAEFLCTCGRHGLGCAAPAPPLCPPP